MSRTGCRAQAGKVQCQEKEGVGWRGGGVERGAGGEMLSLQFFTTP